MCLSTTTRGAHDQRRACTNAAARHLAVLKHITLNLIRLHPVKPKGSIKTRTIIPPPPTPTALNSSDANDVHAIALRAGGFAWKVRGVVL